jgi:hypothetical protein
MQWVHLGIDLYLGGFGVWLLLIAYRVVGAPPGADGRYDDWYRQWSVALKRQGWGWVVFAALFRGINYLLG